MTSGFIRFSAIAVVAAGIASAQSVMAGALIIHNGGFSTLSIDRLTVEQDGVIRNVANFAGRLNLSGSGFNLLNGNARFDNEAITELSSSMSLLDNAILRNRPTTANFIHSAGDIRMLGSSQILNEGTYSKSGGYLFVASSTGKFQNDGTFTQTAGHTDIAGGSRFNTGFFGHVQPERR